MAKKKKTNKLASGLLWGLIFVTVFGLMFGASQVTLELVNVINPGQIALEITKDLESSCISQVRCNTRNPPQNIPENEFRESCRSACADLTEEAQEIIEERTTAEVQGEVGFFAGLFFNPSALKLGITVIILFALGFISFFAVNTLRRK